MVAFVSASVEASLGTAVEFYNPSINHYFVTAYPEEAAALDAGTNVKGWKRTGGQFSVFTEPSDGLAAVCRFFGTPGVGPNSHFYTADPAECAKVKTLPAWTYEGIAFHIPLPTSGQCGGNWPVYRSYYSDQISDANHRFTIDLTAHARMAPRRGDVLEGIVMCAPVSDEEREADVVRFLEQATLGPTEALVQEVKAKGIEKWLDEQFAMNVTRFTQVDEWIPPNGDLNTCQDDLTRPPTYETMCATFNRGSKTVAWEFFRQARIAPDQVRLRAAYVLHLILASNVGPTYAHANFQQRLRDNAFASYETLLMAYSLSPQLGEFQSWVKNAPEHDGVRPNENYARELLQLFTIGPNQLGDDGLPILDAQGKLSPTYGQSDIETVARILTGFTYPTRPGKTPDFWNNPPYAIGDMITFDKWHDQGAKSALAGRITFPAGGTASQEVRATLHALVGHPNAPAFIVKQLIQRTVTSSPTPGYVARVASVFRDSGKGVRGDLAAVFRAIYLDPEARGARKIDREYGRLREPALLWTNMIRSLDVSTDGVIPTQWTEWSEQRLFEPETVFGYYPADYTLAGSTIPAPEFAIFSTGEFMQRANLINLLLYNVDIPWTSTDESFGWAPRSWVPNAIGTRSPPLAIFLADATDVPALVDRVDRLYLHRTMSASMRRTIVNAVEKLAPSDSLRRVKLAINLALTSVDYQVQK